jgi:hypothetical protein
MCYNTNFDGVYFRSFTLPEVLTTHASSLAELVGQTIPNNALNARSYYMRVLDLFSCIECVFPIEDYHQIKEKE